MLLADRICKDYGLDPVSAGSVLGALAELKSEKIEARELEGLLEEMGEGGKAGEGARKYLSSRGEKISAWM